MEIVELVINGDKRGSLIAINEENEVPFKIRRVYYIFDTKEDVSRGFHAHKNLKQVLISVKGKCKVLVDDGTTKNEYLLDSPDKGLLIDDFVWREIHQFSADCILLVLANQYYNENDYIRSYKDFLKEVRLS